MRRRTVLHLIDTGGPGGAETVFLKLIGSLDRERWRSVVVVPEQDWLACALNHIGVRPRLVRSRGSWDAVYLLRLVQLIRDEGIDLVHTHLLSTSVYGSVAASLCGVPAICTFHGQADVPAQGRFRRSKFWILRWSGSRLIFVSEALRQFFLGLGGIDSKLTQVVHNGVDLDELETSTSGKQSFRTEIGVQPGEVLIGAVGNIRESKDYPNLLRAAALLHQRAPRCRFAIVGDDRPNPVVDEVLALRAELGLEDVVTLVGFRDDVGRVLQALDFFVMSSKAEGFSLTTVQAMATGLPIVATRCGGPDEILRDGASGVLVPPRSPEALADALHALLKDPSRSRRLAEAARIEARSRFALAAMVREYESTYQACLRLAPVGEPISSRRSAPPHVAGAPAETERMPEEAAWR